VKTNSSEILLLARKHIVKRKQFILYALIGVSGVVIDYIAYALGIQLLGLGVLLANFISISLGIINNFILNTRYNFRVTDHLWTRFGIFYSVGFLGLIFSDLLLIAFRFGLNIGPLYAKLLTLPLVLIGQYLLNRYFSFGSITEAKRLFRVIWRHWPAYLLTLFFLMCSMAFISHLPTNFKTPGLDAAPDESTHYTYNVQFILEHHHLPISGRDDLGAYKTCRNDAPVVVPCLYSYSFYPGPSYVVAAASASIGSKALHITPQVAARLPGLLYGAIFVLCTYFSTLLIARSRRIATLLTVGVAFIPQLIFTVSYTNLDAHSIAISGLLCLAFVAFLQRPDNRLRGVLLAVVAGGLLPLAKYNYFVLIVPVLGALAWMFVKKRLTRRQLAIIIAWGVGSFIVLASFWYLRNFALYHDPLGQSFALDEMKKYHALGQPLPSGTQSLVRLTDMSFFDLLFRSYYVAFGSMFYYLNPSDYTVPKLFFVFGGVYLINRIVIRRNELKPLLWAVVAYAVLFVLTFIQVFYNSAHYDFQPQGRYMFPILLPTALLCAYAFRYDRKSSILTILFAAGTLFMFTSGAELFIQVYMHVT
jgi:putative flippase GtrA